MRIDIDKGWRLPAGLSPHAERKVERMEPMSGQWIAYTIDNPSTDFIIRMLGQLREKTT